MKPVLFARFLCLALVLSSFVSARAQWMTQTVVVTNGWTAAYLFVDASSQNILPTIQNLPISPGNPIDQIWLWKTPVSDAQYITTPESPLSGGGQWLTWSRTNNQNTLSALIPNAAYLIHSTASSNFSWSIKGQPVLPSYTWDMTGLNFIGFSTPPVNPPNFQNYFAQDPAIASTVQIFQYIGGEFSTNPANPAQVFSQFTTPVTRGKAFWISATNVYNAYYGPFSVNLPSPGGLNFGVSGGQFTLHLRNVTANPLTIYLSLLPSETPPFGQSNIVATPPMLLEGSLNSSNLTYAYTSLPANSSPSASWTLPPSGQSGSDIAVVLGVNRYAMTNSAGSLYAGILQFTDSLGFSQINVPVSATAANTGGLWVGNASVTGVSYDLKSYATNSDGSLVISAVTNLVVTTNYVALGMTTNLLINNFANTNQTTTYYQLTNQVINTYTTEAYQFGTNGFVLTTNQTINYTALTEQVIETDVTGYYFTNNGGLLVWETTNIDYSQVTLNSASTTNLMVITNSIAVVPTNGTPVLATNFIYFFSSTTNLLVTNGIYMAPATNLVFYLSSSTTPVVVTNAAYDVIGSNLVTTGITTTTNWLFTTNLVAGGLTLLTNSTGGASLFSAATTPQLLPGGTYYLGVQNTNPAPVNYAVQVNFHLLSGAPAAAFKPVIQATNNGYMMSWFAPSNNLFQVQWTAGLSSPWQTFSSPAYLGYNPGFPASGTNAQFTFFDNGSQTGGSLPANRFYRLVEPGILSNLANGVAQTNTVAAGTTVYYAINVPAGANMATNQLLFAGAPVNLLYNSTPPAGMNSSSFSSSSQPVASNYAITNSPVISLTAVTNYFPTTKPLFATTNGAGVIFINPITNNYLGDNWAYNYYTTNYQIILNNFLVINGATNLVSSATNLMGAWYSQTSTQTTNFSFNLSLAIGTNAAYVIATNPLVSSVSNYVVTAHNTSLDAVASPYPLRLIAFNDSSGHCSLMQRVYYGIQKGTQGTNIVVTTTQNSLDPAYLNSARRISATALPWTPTNTIWAFTGGPLAQGATLTATVFEPYDDQAANPFLHTYHPDHNNLNMNFSPPHELPVGSESYAITRQITLSVVANSADFISLTTANTSLSGLYNETITLTGLKGATKSYQTSGAFILKQISPITTLTTQ